MSGRSLKAFVGIDISKDKFDACCIGKSGEKFFQASFPMNRNGFDRLIDSLNSAPLPGGAILIGMESTACYHINLFSFLAAQNYKVVIINPLLICNYVKLQLRKTKTDKKDAHAIAQYLLAQCDGLSMRTVSAHISELRDLSRQRESLISQMTALKCDMKRILSITFPELEKIADVFTKSMLGLLSHFSSACALAKARPADITKALSTGSRGRPLSSLSVNSLVKSARLSVGTSSPSRELVLKQKASILIHLKSHLKELNDMLIELSRSKMDEPIRILTSVQGIGDNMATNFMIEMGGDIQKFANHRKLIAVAGIDPAVYQSGKHEGHGGITKRGNRHLRRVIWLMSTHVIMFNETFRTYYRKRIQDGLPYKKAVLATAHKLLRVIFAMLSKKTEFCEANS